MIQQTQIPFPLGGVSDIRSAEDQDLMTTPNAENMRSLDPYSGRKRGGQRSGITKFIPDSLGTGPVQDVITINKDVQLATYTARTTAPDTEWSKSMLDDTVTRDVAETLGGDVWSVSGQNLLIKHNSAGRKIVEVNVPLTYDSEIITSVALSPDGAVFVSSKTLLDVYAGKVFRYEPDPLDDLQMLLVWTRESDSRIPSIFYDAGVLYLIENRIDVSTLRALSELATDVPVDLWDAPIPNPSAQVIVNKSHEILVASEPKVGRDVPDVPSTCGIKDVSGFQPFHLASGELHFWLDATKEAGYANLQNVDFLVDWSGNNRNLHASAFNEGPVAPSSNFHQAPRSGGKFLDNAICGMPGIRFDHSQSNGNYPGFISNAGAGAMMPQQSAFFMTMLFVAHPKSVQGSGKSQVMQWGSGNSSFSVIVNEIGNFVFGLALPYPWDNNPDDGGGTNNGLYAIDGSHPHLLNPSINVDVNRFGGRTINNIESMYLLTIAIDPHQDPTDPANKVGWEGSFLRVFGETGGGYTNQFTCDRFGPPHGVALGWDPWGGPGFDAQIDLCEIVVYKGDYQWPSNYKTTGYNSTTVKLDPAGVDPWPGAPSVPPANAGEVSDMEKIEGYMAYKYGVQSLLDPNHPFASTGAYPGVPPIGTGTAPTVSPPSPYLAVLTSPDGIVSKYGAAGGSLKWAWAGSGVGYTVAVDEADGVYCTGPDQVAVPDGILVRKLIDTGFDIYDVPPNPNPDNITGMWSLTDVATPIAALPTFPSARTVVDSEKNFYVPVIDAGSLKNLYKIAADGSVEWTALVASAGVYTDGYCCAADVSVPDYEDTAIGEPEFMYVGTGLDAGANGEDTIFKIRLVDSVIQIGAPRENVHLAVCDGNIWKMDPNGASGFTRLPVTNGTGALDATSMIVVSVFSQGKVYYTDGVNYKVYDPKTDAVSDWESDSAGEIPQRGKLIVEWNSRVLLARTAGEPQNTYFSEVGKPNGWDLFPPVLKSTSAIGLAASQAGPVPDTVNCLIPYTDSKLIIGGDHSIHMLLGDPLAGSLNPAKGTFQSGQIILISDTIGMAFGRPWCTDESGVIYFFGSRGGVYRMIPGSPPQRISNQIDHRIKQLDLNYFTARLVWNTEERGFHLYFVQVDTIPASPPPAGAPNPVSGPQPGGLPENPTGQAGANLPILHWFWFAEDQSWWSDRFDTHDMDPSAIAIADGDGETDRVMIIGCNDGYVRFWDKSAKSDDGLAIVSSVTFGPIRPKSIHDRVRFNAFKVALGADPDPNNPGALSGAQARLFRSDESDLIGAVIDTKAMTEGRNPAWRSRIRGKSVFFQLYNETVDQRFAFESLGVDVVPSGRVRV